MLNIKTLAAATVACGLALAVVATESVGSVNRGDRATLSFNRTVALPGVTLAPGSYVFEIVDNAGYLDVVRVRNSQDPSARVHGVHQQGAASGQAERFVGGDAR